MKRSRRHALGQHFLDNPSLLDKIAALVAPGPEETVLEIGAGEGALTRALAEKAGRVIAVEKDHRLIPALRASVPSNVTIIEGDILDMDLGRLIHELNLGPLTITGNLPYSISTPLLFRILDSRASFQACFFLLQKEVADRLGARPGTKAYAPLSILFQNVFAVRREFAVRPGSFRPPPKVDSAFVSLRPRAEPLSREAEDPGFRVFLRTAFAHRRKTLRKNLEAEWRAASMDEAWKSLSLELKARAEELAPERLAALYRHLASSPGNRA